MKGMKRFMSLLLALVMVLSVVIIEPVETSAASSLPSGISKITKDKVYIYSYNDELNYYIEAFNKKYPKYAGLIELVIVERDYVNAYPDLIENSIKSDKKPSLINWETEDYYKAFQKKFIVPLSKIGFKESWYKNAYSYTKQLGKYNGKLTAVSPYISPSTFIYRKDIAKEIFGKSDVKTIQSKIKSLSAVLSSAKQAKKKGYKLVPVTAELERPYLFAALKKPILKNGKVTLPSNLKEYAKTVKEMADKGYSTNSYIWGVEWYDGIYSGDTLGYFGPLWFLDVIYAQGKTKEEKKNIAVAETPNPYYWGGTGLTATSYVKNKGLVQLFLYTITCDSKFMTSIGKDLRICPNNTTAMKNMINSKFGKNLGYANDPYVVYDSVAKKIKNPILDYTGNLNSDWESMSSALSSYQYGQFSSYSEFEKFVKNNMK